MAASVPLLVALIIDWQSVRILWRKGLRESTKCNAHSSATAVVAIREGGVPTPYPNRTPLRDITTIPQPMARWGLHDPCSKLPSQCHVPSCKLSLVINGLRIHLREPSFLTLGRGTFNTNKPLVRNSWSLSPPVRCLAISVVRGCGGKLLPGQVLSH